MKSRLRPPVPVRSTNPNSRISTDLRHIMVEIDPYRVRRHSASKSKGRWRGRFTIAAWVRFPEGLYQQVGLVLVYRDSERRKSFRIDTCRANRQSLILLNGSLDLDFDGEITDMALVLEGLSENAMWILDEYNIEPAGAAARKSESFKSRITDKRNVTSIERA